MGFASFLGNLAGGIGRFANAASTVIPKVVQGVQGVANIANAFKQGTGQRQAISSFVGDMFGSNWGKIANQAIGAGEQIFRTGKSVVSSAGGFKSNPLGTIQNIASGMGRIGNIVSSTGNSINSAMGRSGSSMGNGKIGQIYNKVSTALSPTISGLKNVASAGQGAYNQLKNPVSQAYSASKNSYSALRSAFNR